MAVATEAEMENRHTALRLYRPIREVSFISTYFPSASERSNRGSAGRRGAGRASSSLLAQPPAAAANERGRWRRDAYPDAGEQRAQSYKSADELLSSCEATKAAVAELRWLAAEHHQLLADLLALCGDCATRIKMGNQDGKIQEHPDGGVMVQGQGGVQALETSRLQHPLSPDRKKGTLKSRKLKKLAGKKTTDNAEELLQSKIKKKVDSAKTGKASTYGKHVPQEQPKSPGPPGSPRCQASLYCPDTPETASYASVGSEPLLPMDDDFHMAREGWDFMEDSQAFVPGADLCAELSDYHSQLYLGWGPIASSSLLEDTQGMGAERLASGSNLRPSAGKSSNSSSSPPTEQCVSSDGAAMTNSAIGLHNQANRKEAGVKSALKSQQDARDDPKVGHIRTDGQPTLGSRAAGEAASTSLLSRDSSGAGQGNSPQVGPDMRGQKNRDSLSTDRPTGSLRLPLSSPTPGTGKIRTKSPSSPSISGVFNTSFPASNSLQSMSPLLSPLSSRLPSPQLNHRILLLPEERDGVTQGQGQFQARAGQRQLAHDGAAASPLSPEDAGDEPRVTTEVIDKNGNKRTITRLDLNLSRREGAGNSRWNASSTSPVSTATGESVTDSLVLDCSRRSNRS